ncbi:MAG: YicC/YloC family endoribonuclease [Desulfobacterales bacterium]
MIKSMTAFAQAKSQAEDFETTVEIRTYNSRFLDLNLRLPAAYAALEDRIKQQVQDRLSRGRVEIRLQLRETDPLASAFEVDEVRAKGYADALGRLKSALGLSGEVTVDMVAAVGDVIRPVEVERDLDARWPALEAVVDAAIDELEAMRLREGASLEADCRSRLEHIEAMLDQIEALSDGLLAIYQERLQQRVSALVGDSVEIDPARLAQEAAILAEKSDISEEIVRARSHIAQFRTIMASGDSAGRKLNFLLQEFNREFNTMGSKTTRSEVAHRVVDVKSEVEKIREQIQNIE